MVPELFLLILLNLILGIAFGFIHRGRENYTLLLRNGAIAGLILGVLFVLAAQYLLPAGMGFSMVSGVLAIFVEILIFLVVFVVGTVLGDRIEVLRKK